MMIERTLVLVKPDGVQRGLVGEVISRIERCGLKVIGLKMAYADEKTAGEHYADDEAWMRSTGEKALANAIKEGREVKETALEIGKRVRKALITFISMSPIVAIAVEGHRAVPKIRSLIGDTNPQNAAPGTIRGDFTIDSYYLSDNSGRPIQNIVHASGTKDEGLREINVWFNKNELHPYKRIEEDLIYRRANEV
jgi:nucleoside-diphosphate kinase